MSLTSLVFSRARGPGDNSQVPETTSPRAVAAAARIQSVRHVHQAFCCASNTPSACSPQSRAPCMSPATVSTCARQHSADARISSSLRPSRYRSRLDIRQSPLSDCVPVRPCRKLSQKCHDARRRPSAAPTKLRMPSESGDVLSVTPQRELYSACLTTASIRRFIFASVSGMAFRCRSAESKNANASVWAERFCAVRGTQAIVHSLLILAARPKVMASSSMIAALCVFIRLFDRRATAP